MANFRKVFIKQKMCALNLTKTYSEIFLIPKEFRDTLSLLFIALHVKHQLFFPYFKETLIFSADFRKIL